MKNILISGCSFSEWQRIPDTRPYKWISWTDFLFNDYKNFNIINKAQSSFSQSMIVQSIVNSLIESKFDIDHVIVQWTGIGRGYATDEKSFLKRIYQQKELFFAPYLHEYLTNENLKEHDVVNLSNVVSSHFYQASLTQIFLLKNLLNQYQIPYTMFWGWEQINDDIEKEHSALIEQIYNENFIRFGKHGGMSEYIVSNIGVEAGIISEDFHPTTEGQLYFYKNIIRSIIEKL